MTERIAIFDIGSNAVRLVLYDGAVRAPVKTHNERNICGLGAGVAQTGRLDPLATEKAIESLRRFGSLVDALNIRKRYGVATAALRDAQDGDAFVEKIRNELKIPISIITGAEEARLAAQGVMMNGLGQDGLIGDFGGGSLELIATHNGHIQSKDSLPIGSHRLHALKTREEKIDAIRSAFLKTDILKSCQHKQIILLGGAWRSTAKAYMHFTRYPLRVLDHYVIDGHKAHEFASLLSRQSIASLEKIVGFTKKRVRDIGVAALVLEYLCETLEPSSITFSATGIREGILFDTLSEQERKQDALLASCAGFALQASRFQSLKPLQTLAHWLSILFPEIESRLIHASCFLSDTARAEHEDYQASLAFQRLFVFPFYAASHSERAFLALSQYVRYKGYLRRSQRSESEEEETLSAQTIAGLHLTNLAVHIGLAQRIAYLLTGGALELLEHMPLDVTPHSIQLQNTQLARLLQTENVHKIFSALAQMIGRKYQAL